MSALILKTSWKGFYLEPQSQKPFKFTMDLTDINGVITGICREPLYATLTDKDIAVTGFVEDGMISFIKQYPVRWYIDAGGNFKIDVTRKHTEIHYSGTYEDKHKLYSGQWEMDLYETEDQFGKFVAKKHGKWLMFMVNISSEMG